MMRLDLGEELSNGAASTHAHHSIEQHDDESASASASASSSSSTTPSSSSDDLQSLKSSARTAQQQQKQLPSAAAMRSGKEPHPIPFHYRLTLLYLEPLFALNGAYLLLSSPLSFLAAVSTSPSASSSSSSSQHLLSDVRIITDQLGILHLVFAFNLAVVLRSTRDLRTWRLMCAGMLLSDVLHILAQARELGWDRCWEPAGWRASDWANLGVLWWMGLTRLGVVAGWGIGYT